MIKGDFFYSANKRLGDITNIKVVTWPLVDYFLAFLEAEEHRFSDQVSNDHIDWCPELFCPSSLGTF